jgi:hypothetical protein
LEVYSELRRSLHERTTDLELLDCAASLVDFFNGSGNSPRFDTRIGGLPFEQWALDAAFADGGWRVMNHEISDESELARQEAEELKLHNALARWQTEMS